MEFSGGFYAGERGEERLRCSGWFGPESDMEFTVKPKHRGGRGGGGGPEETGAGE